MAIQYGVALRTAQMAAIEAAVGTTPKLQLRTGAQPANCGTADSGTLLCEITLPSDWLATASAGAVTIANGPWAGTAVAAGTALHWRLKDSAGSVCHAQGTIASPTGGDMNLDNAVLAVSQAVSVSAFTLTAGNA